MNLDPPSRTYYSPVLYWTSEWSLGKLTKKRINKESRAYHKAYDAYCVRKTNERKRDING